MGAFFSIDSSAVSKATLTFRFPLQLLSWKEMAVFRGKSAEDTHHTSDRGPSNNRLQSDTHVMVSNKAKLS